MVLTSKSIDSEFLCSYRLRSVHWGGGGYFLYKALIFGDVGVLINTGTLRLGVILVIGNLCAVGVLDAWGVRCHGI